ncbi:MAG TPA: DUF4097 family beta strand repeat-containing protein, partial [Pyrinomonadaceae bacterium]|nr:DUF4097 family beta strand repeat-containing protein [Pyrinomonadaceae bacterium]
MIKKLFAVAAATGLLISLAGSTPAFNVEKDSNRDHPGQQVERSMAVDSQATITLCVAYGTLTVRGWDRPEVRVRSRDAEQIEFRRIDKPKEPNVPAHRVDVMLLDKASRANPRRDCQAVASVEMEVPSGATVQVQTRDGNIRISGVAAAYAGSQNGDITIERATKLVEAGSVGGSIFLRDSSGRVSLNSAGGGVEASNVRAADADDTFEVGTVSGDIQLDRIKSPKVMAKTVNGSLTMSGALVKSGYYAFTNMTGDVLLALPHDASFRLNAKLSEKRDIVSDFVLKYVGETPPPTPPAPRPAVVPAPSAEAAITPVPKKDAKTPAAKAPKTPAAKEKEKPPLKAGTAVTPPLVVIERPTVVVAPYVRRVEAICGSGDAT